MPGCHDSAVLHHVTVPADLPGAKSSIFSLCSIYNRLKMIGSLCATSDLSSDQSLVLNIPSYFLDNRDMPAFQLT